MPSTNDMLQIIILFLFLIFPSLACAHSGFEPILPIVGIIGALLFFLGFPLLLWKTNKFLLSLLLTFVGYIVILISSMFIYGILVN